MKRSIILIIGMGMAMATWATTAHTTMLQRMEMMILPKAPELSAVVQLRDALQWTAWVTRQADALYGQGVPIKLDGEQLTGSNTSKTMVAWYNLHTEQTDLPNHMKRIKVGDYIKYLIRETGAECTITEEGLAVISGKK